MIRAIMSKKKPYTPEDFPSTEQIRKELHRVNYRHSFSKVLQSTIYALITVAAVAVLVAVLLLPVLQIYGNSMQPSISEGSIVLSLKGGNLKSGDVIAFYYNNKILVKRVIAQPGEWVDIDEAGNVSVNGVPLDEPYLAEKALGETNIELPYQVPESRIFVMGDNRAVSVDSRNTAIGCIAEEQIVGRIFWCIWPFDQFGEVQ